MRAFLRELRNWIKHNLPSPYFWGAVNSDEGYERWQIFRFAIGRDVDDEQAVLRMLGIEGGER